MAQTNKNFKKIADKLYQKFGKPLENKHQGEYVAISKDGGTIISRTLINVLKKSQLFSSDSFIFKIGEKAVWKWRKAKV